jgi:hypothetical protein
MFKQMMLGLAVASLPLVVGGVCLAEEGGTCTSTSKLCIDARTGEPRICVTTTCYDKDGKEISSTTVVTKQGDTGAATGPKPKVPNVGVAPGAVVKP